MCFGCSKSYEVQIYEIWENTVQKTPQNIKIFGDFKRCSSVFN